MRHFGAVADGKSNNADAINEAIAACNAAGGGTVFVPSGVYATGSIHLKSDVTLALDAGATLKALPDADTVLLIGENLENVNIYGPRHSQRNRQQRYYTTTLQEYRNPKLERP